MKYTIKRFILLTLAVMILFLLILRFEITGRVISNSVQNNPGANAIMLFLLIGLLIFISKRETLENKISKKLTGMSYANPEMAKRIIEDQKIVRAKYNLPKAEMINSNPVEYERKIVEIAKENGLEIEKGNRIPYGIRAMHQSGKILLSDSKDYEEKSSKYLNALTHEVVHGLQNKRSPSMPIEVMEYEAYLVSGTNDPRKLEKKKTRRGLFGLIGDSVNWAKHHGK